MNARHVIARIEALGGTFIRQRGSHRRYSVTYRDGEGAVRSAFTTVPAHAGRDIPAGTLRGIQADLEAPFGKGWLL